MEIEIVNQDQKDEKMFFIELVEEKKDNNSKMEIKKYKQDFTDIKTKEELKNMQYTISHKELVDYVLDNIFGPALKIKMTRTQQLGKNALKAFNDGRPFMKIKENTLKVMHLALFGKLEYQDLYDNDLKEIFGDFYEIKYRSGSRGIITMPASVEWKAGATIFRFCYQVFTEEGGQTFP